MSFMILSHPNWCLS